MNKSLISRFGGLKAWRQRQGKHTGGPDGSSDSTAQASQKIAPSDGTAAIGAPTSPEPSGGGVAAISGPIYEQVASMRRGSAGDTVATKPLDADIAGGAIQTLTDEPGWLAGGAQAIPLKPVAMDTGSADTPVMLKPGLDDATGFVTTDAVWQTSANIDGSNSATDWGGGTGTSADLQIASRDANVSATNSDVDIFDTGNIQTPGLSAWNFDNRAQDDQLPISNRMLRLDNQVQSLVDAMAAFAPAAAGAATLVAKQDSSLQTTITVDWR